MKNKNIELTNQNQKESMIFEEKANSLKEFYYMHKQKKEKSLERLNELNEVFRELNISFINEEDPKKMEKLRAARKQTKESIEEEELLTKANPRYYLAEKLKDDEIIELKSKAVPEYVEFVKLLDEEKERIEVEYKQAMEEIKYMKNNHKYITTIGKIDYLERIARG